MKFKQLTNQELEASTKDLISIGLLKKKDDLTVELTSVGEGKVIEYIYDLTDILLTCKDFNGYPRSYVSVVAAESITETFQSKALFLIYVNASPDWKDRFKELMNIPVGELRKIVEEHDIKLNDSSIDTVKSRMSETDAIDAFENEDNVIIFPKKNLLN